MKKFVCSVCGYVHNGDQAPHVCPVCGVTADKFKEQSGPKTWAAAKIFLCRDNRLRRPQPLL